MASLVGKTLGKYQISERLGRGGMAEVYKAFHPQLERYAAIKVLHGFLAEGEDFQLRFQREAKAIAALRHPHIVQIYDIDIEDESYYMVMEFIDGGTLKERLLQNKGPLPIAEMAHIFKEVASALGYAHRQGVLHRDIKPANVLLDKSGRTVLTDFGIARIVSETQFTVTGTLVGTPAYMSPEQGKGLPIDTTSDIYSLGIILYEMVTGKVPFDADTPLAVIHKHINEPLPPPRSLREDIPAALEDVILKALAKEPGDRYQTSEQLAEAADQAFQDFAKITQSETMVEIPQKTDLGGAPEMPEDTIASKETVAMEPDADTNADADPAQTFTSKSTVAMEPETAPEDIAERATVAMDADAEPQPNVVEQSSPKPQIAQPTPQFKQPAKVKPLPIILGVIVVAAIAALGVWAVPKYLLNPEPVAEVPMPVEEPVEAEPSGEAEPYGEAEPVEEVPQEGVVEGTTEGECATPEECHALAEETWGSGDLEGAIALIERAISLVPENEHPPYAQYWCMRGEAFMALDRYDEAIWSFEDCLDWTEGDPALEDLRQLAHEQIEILSGNISVEPFTGECTAPDECFSMAEMLRGDGDLGGAIEMLNVAIAMVPEEEQPPFHFLMCTMGEVFMEMESWDEAQESFANCIAWTHEDPDLEGVRAFAQEQMDIINSR